MAITKRQLEAFRQLENNYKDLKKMYEAQRREVIAELEKGCKFGHISITERTIADTEKLKIAGLFSEFSKVTEAKSIKYDF